MSHALINVGNAELSLNVEATTAENHSKMADALPAKTLLIALEKYSKSKIDRFKEFWLTSAPTNISSDEGEKHVIALMPW